MFICMRTTLDIDDETLARASKLTGITEKTALVGLLIVDELDLRCQS